MMCRPSGSRRIWRKRLAAIGVRRDREPVSVDELAHVAPADQKARQVVDAYLKLRAEAGVSREDAVAEFGRETAYTWRTACSPYGAWKLVN